MGAVEETLLARLGELELELSRLNDEIRTQDDRVAKTQRKELLAMLETQRAEAQAIADLRRQDVAKAKQDRREIIKHLKSLGVVIEEPVEAPITDPAELIVDPDLPVVETPVEPARTRKLGPT